MAERQLAEAIRRAEAYYEETVELGREFDRRLARTKAEFRAAGYLKSE
jgi:hypothetical protein